MFLAATLANFSCVQTQHTALCLAFLVMVTIGIGQLLRHTFCLALIRSERLHQVLNKFCCCYFLSNSDKLDLSADSTASSEAWNIYLCSHVHVSYLRSR